MKRTGLVAVALAAAITVACGGGARDDINENNVDATVGTGGELAEERDTTATGVAGDVQDFVQDAAMHGTAEVELGRIASERAASNEVKQYGQMMVQAHTKANAELKAAVSAHNVPVQEQMDEKHRDLAQKLRTLQGAEFDREYMNAMVEGHEEMKDMLDGRAREAGDTGAADEPVEGAVNQWAAKTLPSVEQHLEQARQIRERVENSRRPATN